MWRSSGGYFGSLLASRVSGGFHGVNGLELVKRFPTTIPKYPALNLPELDKKWRSKWAEEGWVKSRSSGIGRSGASTKEKMYILPMFPYPSGDLHLGHLRVYTISDVLARFRRMQGYDVIHPIGWDAFGLPAENAAIERGIDPKTWTKSNIEKMKGQLKTMNGHWDWDREFATCDPSFYKHTQQLFVRLHKAGLAYQAESFVNYDPVDKTVLANEQVDANGCSWRSGAKVEKRMLKQWFLKISDFREELLDGLKELEKGGAWPERVLSMQRNWIGKSSGARIKFQIVLDGQTCSDIEVFTTRPDTLFGVQYLGLASTHPLVQQLAKTDVQLLAFLNSLPNLPPDSKAGYVLPGIQALNPLSQNESTPDATKSPLPVYVAPYVLGDYGDGAVMGVPGHDTRDHAFWKHNRSQDPVRFVVAPSKDGFASTPKSKPFLYHGFLTQDSGPYASLTTAKATEKIVAFLKSSNLGSPAETWRLRDWLVSRQRYWGTPIPIIHCGECGPVVVPEKDLPVELPDLKDHWGQGKTGNPLEHVHEWVNTKCPSCDGPAKRDTDTMDTFVDSSWYFMRFPDSKNERDMFSPESANTNLPVDLYVGGVEHAILHLLYARFISKFMATTDLWPSGSRNLGEPFKKVLAQGMVHGKTYSDPDTGRFLKPNELTYASDTTSAATIPTVGSTGIPARVSFEKMSKSKYNGVDPGVCMEKYGADTTRAHILFQAPVSEVLDWDEEKISGVTRWLKRLYEHITHTENCEYWMGFATLEPFIPWSPKMNLTQLATAINELQIPIYSPDYLMYLISWAGNERSFSEYLDKFKSQPNTFPEAKPRFEKKFEADKKLWRAVQTTIENVTDSYSRTHSLNTIVSDLMSLTNTIIEYSHSSERYDENGIDGCFHLNHAKMEHAALKTLVRMMAPITPAFAEECWSILQRPHKLNDDVLLASDVFPTKPDTDVRGSVFDQSFPIPDGTLEMMAPTTRSCAVQVNGKLKVVLEIPVPSDNLKGKELETWIKDKILETEEAKMKLMGEKGIDVRMAKKVIVVQGGKTINFVV